MRLLLAFVLLASATACVIPALPPLEGEEHTLSVDASFTPGERAGIQAAADTWRAETKGRFNVRVTEASGEVELHRGPAGLYFGHFDRGARTITIDADNLNAYDRGVQAMTANMLGQFVGMSLHDGCGVLGRECVVAEFTEADRASCSACE